MPLDLESEGEYYTREFRERMRLLAEFFDAEKRVIMARTQPYGQELSLRLMRRRMENHLKQAERRARTFAQRDIVQVYLAGARSGSGMSTYRFNRFDTAAIKELSAELEKSFAAAFRDSRRDIARVQRSWAFPKNMDHNKKSHMRRWRGRLRNDYISPKVDLQQYLASNERTIAKALGIPYVSPPDVMASGTKMNAHQKAYLEFTKALSDAAREGKIDEYGEMIVKGKRWKTDTYFSMVARAAAQKAFNIGSINGAERASKATVFEVSDGPDCGWRSHDDSVKAVDLQFVSAQDARAFPIAHPNCRRTFTPRPDIKGVPPSATTEARKGRSRINKEFQAFKSNAGLVARSLAQIPQNTVRDTAAGLVRQMIGDARYRSRLFNRVIQSNQMLRTFDNRVQQVAAQIGRRLGRAPSDRQVARNVVAWMDDLIEGPADQAVPGYVSRILQGNVDANLRRVVNGPDTFQQRAIFTAMDDFDAYAELIERRDMTHQMLNITNSIEREYGTEWLKRVAQHHGNMDGLQSAIRTFNARYQPGRQIREEVTRRVAAQIPQTAYRGLLKTPFDKYLPRTEHGRVTLVRLSPRMLRADYLGLRYAWDSRFLRVQTTTVNRYRYLNTQQARNVAFTKGIRLTERVMRKDRRGLWNEVLRYKSRSALLDEIGYNSGLLTRITLNPHDLLRIGFKFDPVSGWRRPLPHVSLSSPALRTGPLRGLRLRAGVTVNRGFEAQRGATSLERSLRPGVSRAFQNQQRRLAEQGLTGPFVPDGTRIRTVSQELHITLGDRVSLGSLGSGRPWSTVDLPRFEGIGVRATTMIGRMESMADVKEYIRRHGVDGFREDMEFISMLAEMRILGWGWFRIGKTLGLHPREVVKLGDMLGRVWPTYKKEARAATMFTRLRQVAPGMNNAQRNRAIAHMLMFEDELAGKVRFANQAERRKALNQIVYRFNKGEIVDIETARRIRLYRQLLKDFE